MNTDTMISDQVIEVLSAQEQIEQELRFGVKRAKKAEPAPPKIQPVVYQEDHLQKKINIVKSCIGKDEKLLISIKERILKNKKAVRQMEATQKLLCPPKKSPTTEE